MEQKLPVKRRKPKRERMEDLIRVRVTAEQKKELEAAAALDVLDVSTWLRTLGLKAARQNPK